MNVLAVLTRTTNVRYLRNVLEALRQDGVIVDEMQLPAYFVTDQDKYDALIYNTFPDETNVFKFKEKNGNKSWLPEKCDEKFYSFKGKKLLFDTHDNGTKDGFERLSDYITPRIKVNPGVKEIGKLNVVITIPYVVYRIYKFPIDSRSVPLVCAMGVEGYPPIRKKIRDKVEKFNPVTDWLPMKDHAKRLCQTQINVVVPGWGDSSLTHTDTLAAGALLFAHESIEKVKILPYADLKDGINYVSFNQTNVVKKLNVLMKSASKVEKIRKAGLEAFRVGYDINRSAFDLLKVLG